MTPGEFAHSEETKAFTPLEMTHWDQEIGRIKLPSQINISDYADVHNLLSKNLPTGKYECIEIGCAPGKWLAYFNEHFGYIPSGIEYSAIGADVSRKNLSLLNIECEVYHADFFNFSSQKHYDVVFTNGFIEHFPGSTGVMQKLASLLKPNGTIVTIIPNCYGLNGKISKTFRPAVFYGHIPIDVDTLVSLHEQEGFHTLFSAYCGGVQLILPCAKNSFSKRHPRISKLINSPFSKFTRFSKRISRVSGVFPRSRLFSPSLIYIGVKI